MIAVEIDKEKCTGCGQCVDVCPVEAITMNDGKASIDEETCVECGACNTICPTCHCFLLLDQLGDRDLVRYRLWDSCLIKDFAEVAGGANPRPHLWMRLRNRFEKKFDFFPKVSASS